MLGAAKGVLESKWPDVQAYAAKETRNLAETLLMIHKLRLAGEITEKQAELQLRIQRNTAVAVLTATEGISLLMAEEAINAALGVVRDTANTLLGFALL